MFRFLTHNIFCAKVAQDIKYKVVLLPLFGKWYYYRFTTGLSSRHIKKENEFETFAIDNHYARYILENELESGNQETCMEAFNKAHDILMNPIHKTKVRFYPYRVAQNYYPFYEKFYKTMSIANKNKFIKCCKEINNRAKEYAENAESPRSKSDVKKAIRLLDQIINEESQSN